MELIEYYKKFIEFLNLLLDMENKPNLVMVKDKKIIFNENNVDIKKKHQEWILDGEKRNYGDINGNGYIDINDTQIIQRHIAAINDSKIANIHPEWIIK